jgi:ElaA protein
MLKFKWYHFNELNVKQLYELLALRSEVFVVEQQSLYLDIDGKDPQALHLIGTDNDSLVAYLRLFPPVDNTPIVFGRVLSAKSGRNKGYGKKLMNELLNYCREHYPDKIISCSAQHYLVKFYEGFGFKTEGDVYNEDGIPHINMHRND